MYMSESVVIFKTYVNVGFFLHFFENYQFFLATNNDELLFNLFDDF